MKISRAYGTDSLLLAGSLWATRPQELGWMVCVCVCDSCVTAQESENGADYDAIHLKK